MEEAMVPRERYAITFLKFFFYVLFANNMKQKMAGTGGEGHKRTVCDFILELYTVIVVLSLFLLTVLYYIIYISYCRRMIRSVSLYIVVATQIWLVP